MSKVNFIRYFLSALLLYIVFLTVRPLLQPGYYPMHDDIQPIRLLEMDKCIKDFQIPCRWVPDMGYGYGYPQFNYYAPLPYYAMELIHITGFGILDSIKIYLIIITAFSILAMYKLASRFWQSELAGFITAAFYAFLPYRAVNLYVRGAVGEYTAQALMPLILLFSLNLIKEKGKLNVLLFSLSVSFLCLSHTISTLIFTPFLAAWMIFIYESDKKIKLSRVIKNIGISTLGVITLSSFFVIPAFFERGYIHMDTLTTNYFDFRGHFLSIYQILFSNNWGYGSSLPGSNDQIMLGIGVLYWFLSAIALLIAIILKKKRKTLLLLNALSWISLFLIHSKSIIFWRIIPFMNYFQFPWRFNIIAGLFFSLIIGYYAIVTTKKYEITLIITALLISVILLYGSFFRPERWLNISDSDKLTGDSWRRAQTISINDYLPVYTSLSPVKSAESLPVTLSGEVQYKNVKKGSDWQEFSVEVVSDAKIQAQIFYFPVWNVYIDGVNTPFNFENYNGLITFNVNKGSHLILLKLSDTPVRTLGNVITLLGFPVFIVFLKKYKYER